ncbi:hypothetical protein F511_19890 [Dorcoceras hygrometricum]|uniref:Uncharacterized protein n=1 Tax=Dorcoceras hygrometricum TaxID=472368 RepID=A0A2Z7BV96_9LAMI|nr:hypothetical protein F511_19890 [Dorcoceras hygrometricum]
MQHAIINAMKCMRAIKDRIARPVYQLAIISSEPLYHAQQICRWKSSVRDYRGPSAHHSSVVDTRIRIISAVIITSLIDMFTLKAVKSDQFVPSTADSTSTDSYKGTGFKWVAIERATLKESSATKISQIIGGEWRQSTEIGHSEQ